MNPAETIILAPIFIILLLVTYKAVGSAFSFGPAGTFTMSICVSLLSVIGISHCLKGSLEVILLPYTALAVAILLLLLLSFIGRYLAGAKECFSRDFDHRKRLKERAKTRNKKKSTYEIGTKNQRLKLR